MAQNKNKKNEKKTDASTWTAYGDPIDNKNSSDNKVSKSPMLEKARQDGNIVKNK